MNKILKSHNLTLIFSLVVIIIMATSSFVAAWLTDEQVIPNIPGTTAYLEPTVTISFADGSSADSYYLGNDLSTPLPVIQLHGSDSTAPNYVENFRVNLNIKTDMECYLRVRVNDEWFLRRTFTDNRPPIYISLLHENIDRDNGLSLYPFIETEGWTYSDGYLYYNQMITSTLDNEAGVDLQVFGSGANGYTVAESSLFTSECLVYLDLVFDIVQANRVEAMWGVTMPIVA